MKESIAKKYKFNMHTGHYEKLNYLNEADESADTNNDANTDDNKQKSQNNKSLTNIETPEVAQLQQQRDSEIAKYNNDIKKYNDIINQLTAKHGDAVTKYQQDETGTVDPKQISDIQKQILQAKKDLSDTVFKQETAKHDFEVKILTLQSKLLESQYNIPGKYAYLNESNIHTAKVYINSLVSEELPIKGMVDVKHTFKLSQLFYGKDKDGYFVLCIDQEDFDRMYKALTAVGYTRDEIIDAIMPQVFDRRGLLK